MNIDPVLKPNTMYAYFNYDFDPTYVTPHSPFVWPIIIWAIFVTATMIIKRIRYTHQTKNGQDFSERYIESMTPLNLIRSWFALVGGAFITMSALIGFGQMIVSYRNPHIVTTREAEEIRHTKVRDWFFSKESLTFKGNNSIADIDRSKPKITAAIESHYDVKVLNIGDDVRFSYSDLNYHKLSGFIIIKAKNASSAQKCSLETLSASKTSNDVILICNGSEPPAK